MDIAVETGTTRNLIQAVLEYRLDGAFVAGPVEHDDLQTTLSFVEELVLVSAPQYRSLETALKEGRIHKLFVFRVGCSYRERLERFLGARGITLINQLEFGTLDGIIGCVGAGLGISMLPLSVVEPYVRRKEVAVHRISAEDARSETVFITRRNTLRSLALEEFVRTLNNTIQGTREKQWKQARRKRPTCFRARREEAWALALNCARAFSRLLANQEKPIVRYAVGIFSIDRDQSSAGALINCSYRVSRYLEPSVRYHPLTSSPMDFEPEVFAFALAYAE